VIKKPPAFNLPKPYPVEVSGWVWNRVLVEASQDVMMAGRFLYRAWKAQPDDLIAWIQAGCKKGYIRNAHKEEDDDPRAVREWIEKHILKYKDAENE
jgi:hypothetical protein